MVVVSRVEDFARMQDDKNIMAMTMPNPVSIPTKPAEIEAVLKAIKGKPYRVVMEFEMILPVVRRSIKICLHVLNTPCI